MIEQIPNLLPLGEKDMKPCRIATRRSWTRVSAVPFVAAVHTLTQLRLASKLASLRTPLPQGERVLELS